MKDCCHYCKKWFFAEKRPINMLGEQQAKRLHESRQPYVAIAGEPTNPTHVISIAGRWVTVSFLDELGREVLNYDFQERREGELFLTMAIDREYEGESSEIAKAITFSFDENGTILIEESDHSRSITNQRRAFADSSLNWESYPAFGSYDHLSRRERDLPSLSGVEP